MASRNTEYSVTFNNSYSKEEATSKKARTAETPNTICGEVPARYNEHIHAKNRSTHGQERKENFASGPRRASTGGQTRGAADDTSASY